MEFCLTYDDQFADLYFNYLSDCINRKVDVALVLDNSESLQHQHWIQLRQFAIDIITDSDVETGNSRFALSRYTHDVFNDFFLDTYSTKDEMINHISALVRGTGGTNTGMSLENLMNVVFTASNGDSTEAPNLAVIVTDGQSNDMPYTISKAEEAKASGIHVIAVGVGLLDTTELMQLASDPASDNAFNVNDFEHLVTIERLIENLFYVECTGKLYCYVDKNVVM